MKYVNGNIVIAGDDFCIGCARPAWGACMLQILLSDPDYDFELKVIKCGRKRTV